MYAVSALFDNPLYYGVEFRNGAVYMMRKTHLVPAPEIDEDGRPRDLAAHAQRLCNNAYRLDLCRTIVKC